MQPQLTLKSVASWRRFLFIAITAIDVNAAANEILLIYLICISILV